jgi:hypothetical protein
MSERKTISINPQLFMVSNKTRKNKPRSGVAKPLKMKMDSKNKTTKYRMLKQIREQQEKHYNDLFDKKSGVSSPQKDSLVAEDPFLTKSDLQDSIDYLKKMSEEIKSKEAHYATRPIQGSHNNTIKYRSPPQSSIENILSFPVESLDIEPFTLDIQEPPSSQPVFGCLKNGKLPTYRTLFNKTQKAPLFETVSNEQFKESSILSTPLGKIKELRMLQDVVEKNGQIKPAKYQYKKKKTTKRRTFHVGKSKVFRKVGVLVSNKSIRKKVTTDTHKWKEKSIDDVRKYLTKHGFIKVGSTAPNDVLRKMYENTMLVGGEIKNHNTENLLYNFLNERPSNPF